MRPLGLLLLLLLMASTTVRAEPFCYDRAFDTKARLLEFGSPLATIKIEGVWAYITVYKGCKRYGVPQKLMFDFFQREQSLAQGKVAGNLPWRTSAATGWRISGIKVCSWAFGFDHQIYGCAWSMRRLYDRYRKDLPPWMIVDEFRPRDRWGKWPTIKERAQGLVKIVKPKNAVEAMIWTYTPHVDAVRTTKQIHRDLWKEEMNYE